MDGKRILLPFLAGVLLVTPFAQAATVRQIQGRQIQDGDQTNGDVRSRGGARGKGRRTARTGQNKFFKQTWIAQRHHKIVAESRRHERALNQARKNLERQLYMLTQTRTFLNRWSPVNRARRSRIPDSDLLHIGRIHTRVLQAYRGSLNALRQNAASTRLAFRRLEREVDAGSLRSRVEAEAVRAENRMRKSARAFHSRVAAHRKTIALLAGKTKKRVQEVLKKGVRPRPPRIDRDGARMRGPRAAAVQAVDRLKKMKPEQRRRLYQNGLRNLRRLKEMEKKLEAIKKGFERLKNRAKENTRKKPVV